MGLFGILVWICAGVGGLLFGYEIGVISQILSMNSFRMYMGYYYPSPTNSSELLPCLPTSDFPPCVSSEQDANGWITSTFLLGCIAGALVVSFTADSFLGRKWNIVLGAFLFTLGGIFQAISTNLVYLYLARIVSGLGVGVMSMIVPVYLCETSPTEIRGKITTIYQLMITIGIVLAACVNALFIIYVPGDAEWRGALAVQVIPGFLLVVLMTFMPRSPRWLASKDRDAEVLVVLSRLRGLPATHPVVVSEFDHIRESVVHERSVGKGALRNLFVRGIRNRLVIGVMLQFFQQWTGINVILYYQTGLFSAMGLSALDANIIFPIVGNTFNSLSTIPGMLLIDRLGRRKLLIIGAVGMAVAHILVTVFVNLIPTHGPTFAWGAIVFVYTFYLFFGATWGPITWVYCGEIFPMPVRSLGTGATTMSNWIWNAIISRITPNIEASVGNYVYLIFAGMCILMAIFVAVWVPETSGKAIEEMDEVFGVPEYRDAKPSASSDVEMQQNNGSQAVGAGAEGGMGGARKRYEIVSFSEKSLTEIDQKNASLASMEMRGEDGGSLALVRLELDEERSPCSSEQSPRSPESPPSYER